MKTDQAERVIAFWQECSQSPSFATYVAAMPVSHLSELSDAACTLCPDDEPVKKFAADLASNPAVVKTPQRITDLITVVLAPKKPKPKPEVKPEPKVEDKPVKAVP